MKKTVTIFFLLVTTISFAQQSQKWKTEIDLEGGFSFTTFLDVSINDVEFSMTSPKNADVRLFGWTKAMAGRLFGKLPKKGILLTIKGQKEGDSLIGNAESFLVGKMEFRGILTENRLSGVFIKNDSTKIGSVTSVKAKESAHINYKNLYSKIIEVTQNNIFSDQVLQTKGWRKFKKGFKELCNNAKDDIEIYIGFKILSQQLPFSHYYLVLQNEDEDKNTPDIIVTKGPSVIFKEKTPTTAYLKIKDFISSKEEIETVFPKIIENKNYKNLIIDLRDNGGGGVDAAIAFARYITNEPLTIGYFPTNKLEYSGFDVALFQTLPEIRTTTTESLIAKLKKTKGVKLVFEPRGNNPVFTGNLYILTNGNTGSTCEPIVYLLKKNGATVVGEKTAGSMLSGTFFEISDEYKLFLPIADFYTYDGVRLEGIGVIPDIVTPSNKALDKTLLLIK